MRIKRLSRGPSRLEALAAMWRSRIRPTRRRVILLAVTLGGPLLATVAASIINPPGTAVPALLYLLAVLATALSGRLSLALVSAGLCIAGFDYFFVDPVHRLIGARRIDFVALSSFVAAAVAVSLSVARARRERSAAALRGRQLEALYQFMAAVLAGETLEHGLPGLARSLRRTYGVRGCRIRVRTGPGPSTVEGSDGDVGTGAGEVVPLLVEDQTVGGLVLFGPSAVARRPEAAEIKAFAAQLALTLEQTRLREEASAARRQAETSSARAALFSSVTHDLKTPLASIKTSASSLMDQNLHTPQDREELVRTILEESDRLERLVSNIMNLSRLRSGTLTPARESVLVEDVVGAVLRRLRPMLAGRAVTVQASDGLPPVLADVVQLDQVITNVVENAARYSPTGSPVRVDISRGDGSVQVQVSDRGPGFPRALRATAFREFVRGDAEGRPAGAGLGLAIAHAIVSAHGGSIWIEDTPGGGASVVFRIPAEPSPEAGNAASVW